MTEQANDNATALQQTAAAKAVTIVEPIAHKTSEVFARYEKMGFERPEPNGEVQKAASAVAPLMGGDPKENALRLLAATEFLYSAGIELKVFTFINDHGDNKDRIAEIEAAEPGMVRSFKHIVGDNQAMEEITKTSEGDIKGLDAKGREYFEKQVQELKGVSPAQIEMVGQVVAKQEQQAATQRLVAMHSAGRSF